jgi:hypothetical protein
LSIFEIPPDLLYQILKAFGTLSKREKEIYQSMEAPAKVLFGSQASACVVR